MEKSKRIRDVIYGFIELDEQELEIIDSFAFQRLRRIKQLALTNLVYPGANHTRFEHSLGVLQMATDMFDSILKTLPDEKTCKNSNTKAILKSIAKNKDRIRKTLRLAALLHDVGHAPFSHATEELFPKKSDGKHFDHEEYSIAIIKECFSEIIEKHSVNKKLDVKTNDVAFVLGDNSVSSELYSELLMFKDIISSQIDADKADYLLRDSLHLGVKYGVFDKDRFVESLTITKDLDRIGIKEKSFYNAESLMIARYQMFQQVYFHKVRRIYDYHLAKAMKEILVVLGPKDACLPSPQEIQEYLKFDDVLIEAEMLKGNGGEHGQRIVNRNHYRFYKELFSNASHEEKSEFMAETKDNTKFHYDNGSMKSYYDGAFNKDIIIVGERDKGLTEVSDLIKALELKAGVARLYKIC